MIRLVRADLHLMDAAFASEDALAVMLGHDVVAGWATFTAALQATRDALAANTSGSAWDARLFVAGDPRSSSAGVASRDRRRTGSSSLDTRSPGPSMTGVPLLLSRDLARGRAPGSRAQRHRCPPVEEAVLVADHGRCGGAIPEANRPDGGPPLSLRSVWMVCARAVHETGLTWRPWRRRIGGQPSPKRRSHAEVDG